MHTQQSEGNFKNALVVDNITPLKQFFFSFNPQNSNLINSHVL